MTKQQKLMEQVREWVRAIVANGYGRVTYPFGVSPNTVYQYVLRCRNDYPGHTFHITRGVEGNGYLDIEVLKSVAPAQKIERLLAEYAALGRKAVALKGDEYWSVRNEMNIIHEEIGIVLMPPPDLEITKDALV